MRRFGCRSYSLPLAAILFSIIVLFKCILLFSSPISNGVNPNQSVQNYNPKHGNLKFTSNIYSVPKYFHVGTQLYNFSKRLSVPVVASTGSDDLDYPLKIDMPHLVQSIMLNRSTNITPVNDPQFKLLIPNREKCKKLQKSTDSPLDLLILIKSAPKNILRRDAIRLTWGSERCWGGRQIVRVFLLGFPDALDTRSQHLIELEAEQYGDIVQQNFIDTYYNNTYKMMMGFDWSIKFCSDAPIIMFVDDDFFVYPKNIVGYLEGLSEELKNRLVSGYVWHNSVPIRDGINTYMKKWAIKKSEYNPDVYPPYIAGGNFFISMNLAKEMSIAIRYTQFLRFDDVFLGIVLRKLLYTPIHQNQIYIDHVVEEKNLNWSTLFSIHNYKTVASQLSLWTQLNCSDFCID